MKHCIICGQECKQGAKYCLHCGKLLRENRMRANNLKKRLGTKLCPICFKPIHNEDTFCKKCNTVLHERKQTLFFSSNIMSKEYLELEYTYIIKNPKFFRKNRKDYVTYDVIELGLKTGYHFSQNLEILYKEGLPKRNRFQSKEKYFAEYIVPVARQQYERWRLNAIGFGVDVAVETILSGKKIDNAKESNNKQKA